MGRVKIRDAVFAERPSRGDRKPRTSWIARQHRGPLVPEPALPAGAGGGGHDASARTAREASARDPDPASAPGSRPARDAAESAAAQPVLPAIPPPAAVPPAADGLDGGVPSAAASALLARLEDAVEEVASVRRRVLAETERQIVELAAAIAERVIAREVALDRGAVLVLAAEGIDALADADRVTVRLGDLPDPDAVAAFRERLRSRVARCEVVHDRALGPGGCVVETDLGRVDESVGRRLRMLVEGLLPSAGGLGSGRPPSEPATGLPAPGSRPSVADVRTDPASGPSSEGKRGTRRSRRRSEGPA